MINRTNGNFRSNFKIGLALLKIENLKSKMPTLDWSQLFYYWSHDIWNGEKNVILCFDTPSCESHEYHVLWMEISQIFNANILSFPASKWHQNNNFLLVFLVNDIKRPSLVICTVKYHSHNLCVVCVFFFDSSARSLFLCHTLLLSISLSVSFGCESN